MGKYGADEKILRKFRTAGSCAYCGTWCDPRVPHHIFPRSKGRIDHPLNLVSLGHGLACPCHADAHAGRILQADFLAIVAAREGLLQHDIERALWAATRLHPHMLRREKEAVMGELSEIQWYIAMRIPVVKEMCREVE